MTSATSGGDDTPSPAEETPWEVRHGEQVYGPYSRQDMRTYIAEGRIVAETPVRRTGETEWRRAAEIAEFQQLFHRLAEQTGARGPGDAESFDQVAHAGPDLHGVPGGASAPDVGPTGYPPPHEARPRGETATLAHIVYGLLVANLFIGFTGLIGALIAHVKRGSAPPWLASHYRWQIRTFWWSLLFSVIGVLTLRYQIGWAIVMLTLIWYIYRAIKGWLRLSSDRAVDDPAAWF